MLHGRTTKPISRVRDSAFQVVLHKQPLIAEYASLVSQAVDDSSGDEPGESVAQQNAGDEHCDPFANLFTGIPAGHEIESAERSRVDHYQPLLARSRRKK